MKGSRRLAIQCVVAGLVFLWLVGSQPRSEAPSGKQRTAEEFEFFESRIRPILVDSCYSCHSSQANPPKGGLRLDTREGLLKGGSRGPVVAPGDPDKSLLIRAVSYSDLDLKMPPIGKLADEEVADLILWVKMGAPDPRGTPADDAALAVSDQGINLEEGRKFWCFQPFVPSAPPQVQTAAWPKSPIDYFIMKKLEEKTLHPAPPADKRALIRRATFDLIGLPPPVEETKDFLADTSPDAYEKLVERLLASPYYGERWGRHWLDLVRFSETNGHEYDDDKFDAWRYRDYVIRAFNEDVPYDQFVREHIAGDLIAEKRLSSDGGYWESPIGTNFFWFGEVLNAATDSIKSRADQVDNQIDVLSKTFLGLTGACARCHDHKFDPIPTADYYALAGIMHSTRMIETTVDSPSRAQEIASARAKIRAINQEIVTLLRPALMKLASNLKDYLLGDSAQWTEYLEAAFGEPDHVFYPFVQIRECVAEKKPFKEAFQAVRQELDELTKNSRFSASRPGDIVFEDFEKLGYEDWLISGQAFGQGPDRQPAPNQALKGYQAQGLANSFGDGSDVLVGSLTSRKFMVPKFYLHVKMGGTRLKEGHDLRFTLVADDFKSELLRPDGEQLKWKTVRLTVQKDRLGYFEIVDRSRSGHLFVDRIVISDFKEPPVVGTPPNGQVAALLQRKDLSSLEALALAYQEMFVRVLESNLNDRDSRWLLAALNPASKPEALAELLSTAERNELARLQKARGDIESKIPESTFAMISRDEDPANIRVHIRGNHKNLGEEVPRRFLQVIAGKDQPPFAFGSGRLQLADWLTRPDNPLAARVLVNWIWKHHFGEGLVRTVDNFGKNGERPTHPELLDYLAARLIEERWSIQSIHRLLMLSSTYQMSSRIDPKASNVDPDNKLLHHIPVRRLEGETIRDSLLAVAGTLHRKLFGPSITPYISKYQGGSGKPKSGPLDGDARRSIYIQVRRNFLTPMFLAFDYPLPITSIGKRTVSTVPAQSLLMMNNELVALQAERWAQQLMQKEKDPSRRVDWMFETAFGRPPEDWAKAELLAFVEKQAASYQSLAKSQQKTFPEWQAWADACHVLFNSAEFIYVQ